MVTASAVCNKYFYCSNKQTSIHWVLSRKNVLGEEFLEIAQHEAP